MNEVIWLVAKQPPKVLPVNLQ